MSITDPSAQQNSQNDPTQAAEANTPDIQALADSMGQQTETTPTPTAPPAAPTTPPTTETNPTTTIDTMAGENAPIDESPEPSLNPDAPEDDYVEYPPANGTSTLNNAQVQGFATEQAATEEQFAATEQTTQADEPIQTDQPVQIDQTMQTDDAAPFDPYTQTTETVEAQALDTEEYAPAAGRSKKKMISCALIALVIGLILFLIVGTFGALVAYGKVNLPNKSMQRNISYFVQELPFTPKTPEYVITKAILAHADMRSASIKASFAAEVPDLSALLGVTNIDMALDGSFDYTNPEKPEMEYNIDIDTLLNADIKLIGETAYGRVNELPTAEMAMFGLSENAVALFEEAILDIWIEADMTEYQSDARDALNDREEQENEEEADLFDEKLLAFFEGKVVPHLDMEKDMVDGFSTYKLSLNLTGEEFGELMNDLSVALDQPIDMNATQEYTEVDNISINIWVDEDAHYVRKTNGVIAMTTNYDYEDNLMVLGAHTEKLGDQDNVLGTRKDMIATLNDETSSTISIAIGITLADHGKDFTINSPDETLDEEEFMVRFSEYYQRAVDEEYINQQPELFDENGLPLENTSPPLGDFEGFGPPPTQENPFDPSADTTLSPGQTQKQANDFNGFQ